MIAEESPVLLFDGVCNLCSGIVRFVLPRSRTIRFASLQSPRARRMLANAGLQPDAMDTVVLVIGERYYTRSDAALELAARLDGPWRMVRHFRVIPRPIRDAMYDLVARSRYRVFGRQDACMMPLPEYESRFLD